ncbi:MAG: hypothetical protein JWL93_974 [Hyphomicrobiales bacterium]|jgi:hypothetical protein|nr:hypothetical protein [Hyphomicrobiales bacterium]
MTRTLVAAIALAALTATPLAAQTPAGTPPKPAMPSSPAQPAADVNANAPKGPALKEEPHGSGSVHEELEAERANPQK